jgi:hypothetical protein
MARERKPGSENIHPVFYIFFIASLLLCLTGMLMAFVICIDRTDELFNNVRYQDHWSKAGNSMYKNRWEPFQGNFIECVKQIPAGFYIGFSKFPAAALVAIVFYPLLVLVFPVYDIFANMDFTMLLLGWLPFLGGVLLFILSGLLAQMSKSNPPPKMSDERKL